VIRIAVLGDSLAVSPTREQGFPTILQERLRREGVACTVFNAGVRGDTTTGGLRRLDTVLAEKPRILILALGANDGLRGAALSTIRQNLAIIVQRAQIEGVRVLLCGMETPPLRGWGYTQAFHHLFPELASAYKVPLVPFLLLGVALNPEYNGDDLIHPNAAGAWKIADTIWPFLRPMIDQEIRAAAG
jgi:acyl-CoA thioesterase-1